MGPQVRPVRKGSDTHLKDKWAGLLTGHLIIGQTGPVKGRDMGKGLT